MRIETKTDNRRKMVQDIAEFTGEELHYVGPPTFSYTVGRLTIDRDGVITSETEEGEDLLTQFLQEKGYLEAPVDPQGDYQDIQMAAASSLERQGHRVER